MGTAHLCCIILTETEVENSFIISHYSLNKRVQRALCPGWSARCQRSKGKTCPPLRRPQGKWGAEALTAEQLAHPIGHTQQQHWERKTDCLRTKASFAMQFFSELRLDVGTLGLDAGTFRVVQRLRLCA